jgi:hypothetical protein
VLPLNHKLHVKGGQQTYKHSRYFFILGKQDTVCYLPPAGSFIRFLHEATTSQKRFINNRGNTMSRLPKDGELNWGGILENFLKQTLDHDGKLVSGPLNPHTGEPNANLASEQQAGLIRLAGDLAHSAGKPKVSGLQGNAVSDAAPKHGQVLAWNDTTGSWEPTDPPQGGLSADEVHARAMAINSMRIL